MEHDTLNDQTLRTSVDNVPLKTSPWDWPARKKWGIIVPIVLVDLTVSFGASGFSPADNSFAKEFGLNSEVATLGLSLYVIALALGPLVLAPLSEHFGRRTLYIISYGLFLLFLLGTALVHNLAGFFILRFLSGICSSVTIANFGGTIADLYPFHLTGPAMSVFLWAATVGSPLGFFLFSFVAQYRPWRDVFWALLGISGGFWVILTISQVWIGETRHTVISSHAKEQQHSGVVSETRKRQQLSQELTRPFRFLFMEAIVSFSAVYNGYLYGLSFLFNGAFGLVFGPKGHGFTTLGVGLSFLGIVIGITIGAVTSLVFQEPRYREIVRNADGRNIPEARVFLSLAAGITFPISLFWFAWTTYASVPWIVPILASALWGWSFYILILMTYQYLEDSYKEYSASALAAIGLARNIFGGVFPLFGTQMFENLGYQWASCLLAFLALLMIPIPFVLWKFGPALRMKSPWARQHLEESPDPSTEERESPVKV